MRSAMIPAAPRGATWARMHLSNSRKLPFSNVSHAGASGIDKRLCSKSTESSEWGEVVFETAGLMPGIAKPEGTCPNCGRAIPPDARTAHFAFCARNIVACPKCGLHCPRNTLDDHDAEMRDGSILRDAIEERDVARVALHVRHHVDVSLVDKNGENCLHAAVRTGNDHMIQLLLQLPAAHSLVDAPNAMHDTPVQLANRQRARNIVHIMRQVAPPKDRRPTVPTPPPTRPLRPPNAHSSDGPHPRQSFIRDVSDESSSEAASGEALQDCDNCGRPVPLSNLVVHRVHCERRCYRCDVCGVVVQSAARAQHEQPTLASVTSLPVCEWTNVIEPAAKHGLDVGVACDANGDTLLHLAVRNHLTDVVRVLLRLGCSPTLLNKLHDTPAQARANSSAGRLATVQEGRGRTGRGGVQSSPAAVTASLTALCVRVCVSVCVCE